MMLTHCSFSTTQQVESTPYSAPRTMKELDADLVERLITGEPGAWRELHERFDRLILSCITRVTARFVAFGPEDVQEIYATLLLQLVSNDMHKLRSFDPERGNRLSSWLGMLAINAAYDYLRSMRRESSRTSLREVESLSCELPDPFEQTEFNQRAEIVAELLAEFSEKDQDFVSLYFGEGLAPADVAERLGISVKTVYSKRHKIQSRLESMLSRDYLAA